MSKEETVSVSADALNNQLVEILKGITETATQAKEFMLAELPDVVVQILNWYFVYGLLTTIVALVAIVVVTSVVVKYSGIGNKINPEEGKYHNHKTTWTHDSDGDIHPGIIAAIAAPLTTVLIGFGFINLQWLKIWIAPKLWLIEYTASLIK